MRFAYADPPYLGCAKFYRDLHPEAMLWDKPETHQALIDSLVGFDGWAMSLHVPSLQTILAMCPSDVRVAAWVKPFASFKPNVNPAYAWEPVIFRGARKRDRDEFTVRDWLAAGISLRRGLTGAKPEPFSLWIEDLLGVRPEDEIVDLFPGTGGVTRAWKQPKQSRMALKPAKTTGTPLFNRESE